MPPPTPRGQMGSRQSMNEGADGCWHAQVYIRYLIGTAIMLRCSLFHALRWPRCSSRRAPGRGLSPAMGRRTLPMPIALSAAALPHEKLYGTGSFADNFMLCKIRIGYQIRELTHKRGRRQQLATENLPGFPAALGDLLRGRLHPDDAHRSLRQRTHHSPPRTIALIRHMLVLGPSRRPRCRGADV